MSRVLQKRLLIVLTIALIIALFWIFRLDRYFTLDYIKTSKERFEALYEDHPAMVIASYMIIYVLVTSLSLPGAAVMTLAGGALFGFLSGLVIVSFASTIGATLACAVSRYVLREWVQKRFGERLKVINEGIEKEGPFYLFTLRLIPLFPFWLVNLVMGLTPMPLGKYYLISQIGMLPGTMVYVNAGRELAKLDSIKGILSPGLILSFALLGLFPLITKKLLWLYKTRKARYY